MRYSRLTQASTLLLFVIMLSCFLLYRTGHLEQLLSSGNAIQESPNGGVIKPNKIDSSNTKRKDSLQRVTLISSSKSVILLKDPVLKFPDSLELQKKDSVENKQQTIMPGSKSGHIFQPKMQFKPKLDTSSIRKTKKD